MMRTLVLGALCCVGLSMVACESGKDKKPGHMDHKMAEPMTQDKAMKERPMDKNTMDKNMKGMDKTMDNTMDRTMPAPTDTTKKSM